MKARTALWATILSISYQALAASHAHAATVPVEIQAALIKKIIQYDPTMANVPSAQLRLLVLDGDSATVSALSKTGIPTKAVAMAELASEMKHASVIYLGSSSPSPEVAALCTEHKVLSFSGSPDLADRGDVSVGLGVRGDGKPEIVVNLARLRAEGHSLAASLLSLARVIR